MAKDIPVNPECLKALIRRGVNREPYIGKTAVKASLGALLGWGRDVNNEEYAEIKAGRFEIEKDGDNMIIVFTHLD